MKKITDSQMRAAAESLKEKWAREDAERIENAITQIAKDILGVETLEPRYSDDLDFYDIGIGSLKKALTAAYETGKADKN